MRLGSTHLRNQNLVTGSNAHRNSVALLVQLTGSDGEDLGFVELLDGALWEEDTGRSLGLSLYSLDKNTVQKRSEALDAAKGGLQFEPGLEKGNHRSTAGEMRSETGGQNKDSPLRR